MIADSVKHEFKADIEAIAAISVVPSILDVICLTTGMGFAAIARVTEQRWITCAVLDKIDFGLLPGSELSLETTICNEVRQSREAVVIDEVAQDPGFCDHPCPRRYGFKSYISVPIVLKNGDFFGTLCAIDPNPATLKQKGALQMLTLFADLIATHLTAYELHAVTQEQLAEEQQIAEFREQFIAILGHDLKNPLGAVLTGAQMLVEVIKDKEILNIARIIKDASFRMSGLIDNILDFASGRLGEGISVTKEKGISLTPVIQEVIAELGINYPNLIETEIALPDKVDGDGKRIAQLFSNLLGNALKHGTRDSMVKVKAWYSDEEVFIAVYNKGEKIKNSVMLRLFQPFCKGKTASNIQGLGLGLYIAYEIALSHKGSIAVASTDEETSFIFSMPKTII